MPDMLSIHSFLKKAQQLLLPVCCNERVAEQEALFLFEFFLNVSRATLFAMSSEIVASDIAQKIEQALDERIRMRKPLQYILGSVPFADLTIKVRPPVLIPRPETEEIVAWLMHESLSIKQSCVRILDLCSGSGCIALSLANFFSNSTVIGVDINPDAVSLAKENAALNSLTSVEFLLGSLYEPLPLDYTCDLIIANPPYIAPSRYAELEPEVRLWEDKRALFADDDGMAIYKEILLKAKTTLAKEGVFTHNKLPCIVLEIGIDQHTIEDLCAACGFTRIKIFNDMQGNVRWVAIWN